jgi:pimeloyl-ACP methyl ester carboxylesterase
MKSRLNFLKACVSLVGILFTGFTFYFVANYLHHSFETRDLDDAARQQAGGSFVRLSDGNVHYEIAGKGSGRTLVLVHGFSVPDYLWDQNFHALVAAGFRVLRYDLYGRGYSDRPDVVYDANLYDRQLVELLSGLKIRPPVDLVGASMGGSIVITFADRHPGLARSLSLLDPAYLTGRKLPFPIRAPLLGEYTMAVFIAPSLPESQMDDFAHPERFPDYVARYRPQMQYKGFRHAILSTIRHYLTRDDTDEYRRVGQSHIPVLLVWGKLDKDVPYAVSEKVMQAIPQAEFHPIEGSAHVPYYENPEIVNPILINFLKKN